MWINQPLLGETCGAHFPLDFLQSLRWFIFISLTGGRYFPTPLKTETLYWYWTPLWSLIHCAHMTNGFQLTEISPLQRNNHHDNAIYCTRSIIREKLSFLQINAASNWLIFGSTLQMKCELSVMYSSQCRWKTTPGSHLRLEAESALGKTLLSNITSGLRASSFKLPLLWSAN